MSEFSDIEWGRMLGRLDNIENTLSELKDRVVWRLDDLESRVEKLELQNSRTVESNRTSGTNSQRIDELEKAHAAGKLPRQIANWSIFALLAMNGVGWFVVLFRMGGL